MAQPRIDPTPQQRYGAVAQSLHWLSAAAVIGMFVLGLVMVELSFSPLQLKMYSWHKWLGVSLFTIVFLRLLWRLWHPAPPLPATTSAWQAHAAQLAHWLLYALMLIIPLTGWLMSSAKGFSTVVFGVLPLPDLLGKNEALGNLLAEIHWWLNKTLLALVLLHVAAALKHHFIDGDGLLWRMLPAGRQQGEH